MGLIRELMFFGLAVLRGMLILVIYDGIRIFRRVLPHGVWSVALEDVLYWFLSALLVFQLIYRENECLSIIRQSAPGWWNTLRGF